MSNLFYMYMSRIRHNEERIEYFLRKFFHSFYSAAKLNHLILQSFSYNYFIESGIAHYINSTL